MGVCAVYTSPLKSHSGVGVPQGSLLRPQLFFFNFMRTFIQPFSTFTFKLLCFNYLGLLKAARLIWIILSQFLLLFLITVCVYAALLLLLYIFSYLFILTVNLTKD